MSLYNVLVAFNNGHQPGRFNIIDPAALSQTRSGTSGAGVHRGVFRHILRTTGAADFDWYHYEPDGQIVSLTTPDNGSWLSAEAASNGSAYEVKFTRVALSGAASVAYVSSSVDVWEPVTADVFCGVDYPRDVTALNSAEFKVEIRDRAINRYHTFNMICAVNLS